MPEFLFFQLAGTMASWGETAVGEIRPTQFHPTKSAILGLLAAAMGVKRSDELTLSKMAKGYLYCAFVQNAGSLLRDYHTVQMPTFNKKTAYTTRREELAGPKHKLNTLLSSREYVTDCFYYVAITSKEKESAPFSLSALKEGLMHPKYNLYLGRKACPVSLPLFPRIESDQLVEQSFTKALKIYRQKIEQTDCFPLQNDQFTVYWESGIPSALSSAKMFKTRDQSSNRKRWQFQEREQLSTIYSLEQED